jgi:hypothetical protein
MDVACFSVLRQVDLGCCRMQAPTSRVASTSNTYAGDAPQPLRLETKCEVTHESTRAHLQSVLGASDAVPSQDVSDAEEGKRGLHVLREVLDCMDRAAQKCVAVHDGVDVCQAVLWIDLVEVRVY